MQHIKSGMRAGRKGLRGSTGRKDGIRSKGRAMKARVPRAGKSARNHADYLFDKQSIVHSYRPCFYRQAVTAIGSLYSSYAVNRTLQWNHR